MIDIDKLAVLREKWKRDDVHTGNDLAILDILEAMLKESINLKNEMRMLKQLLTREDTK